MSESQKIGDILLRKGKITPDELDTALKVRRTSRQRIGQVLTTLGFISELDVAESLAEQFGFDLVDPRKLKPQKRALAALSVRLALAHRILPLKYSRDRLECVMADPIDFPTTDMISRVAGRRIVLHIAPSSALMDAIVDAYMVPAVTDRPTRATSAPKPQIDRDAILAQLSAAAGEGAV